MMASVFFIKYTNLRFWFLNLIGVSCVGDGLRSRWGDRFTVTLQPKGGTFGLSINTKARAADMPFLLAPLEIFQALQNGGELAWKRTPICI